ncbi:radical SAM protein [Kibdelosporangium persicum]|uniref:Pyrroloquinoline quinone biosynthesis protein PqqE n=1 Tax=Kibdelosporangium persicum TaxID=2698649 RepID=A0ABX2FAW4_9PSEU|nr:radical SAM protein [Kibdelosporangium persicum]NRN67905.1 Pyrroloquinoline quinone biosynthesis protein PqqE [Kibdelosporangium persicum]
MRLAEMMALRQEICAGLLVTLTERCPLHCAHCSASAALNGRHLDGVALLRFVRTFTAQCRPDVVMLTGGEPLLRPRLVVETARAAKAAGTRTAVLSGAFFAGDGRIPASIRPAIQAVDHVSLSLDVFHEREVARQDVFAVLRTLLRHGITTSLHITGTSSDDPYLSEVTAEVTRIFGTDVPMLVSEFKPIGRAAAWARATPQADSSAAPCAMAAWPVVTVDAAVVVCCNQDVVDGRTRPDHLRLGVLATSTWPEVHERAHSSPVLRMIRTVGPLHIARCGGTDLADYCGSCQRLAPAALDWATQAGTGPAGELLQAVAVRNGQMGGPRALLRRHGVARYAHLVGDDG